MNGFLFIPRRHPLAKRLINFLQARGESQAARSLDWISFLLRKDTSVFLTFKRRYVSPRLTTSRRCGIGPTEGPLPAGPAFWQSSFGYTSYPSLPTSRLCGTGLACGRYPQWLLLPSFLYIFACFLMYSSFTIHLRNACLVRSSWALTHRVCAPRGNVCQDQDIR